MPDADTSRRPNPRKHCARAKLSSKHFAAVRRRIIGAFATLTAVNPLE
jgi:hypothetical protein